MAFKFSRYLEKHGRYSLSKLGHDASRPKIETLLPRPLEVRATSNLGHFILPYRTSIVPSFIKIGDGDYQVVIDLTWTDPKYAFNFSSILGMLVELKLLKRQDLVGVIANALKPAYDQLHIRWLY